MDLVDRVLSMLPGRMLTLGKTGVMPLNRGSVKFTDFAIICELINPFDHIFITAGDQLMPYMI